MNLYPKFYKYHSGDPNEKTEIGGAGRGAFRFLVGKSEGKRPVGRSRCKWGYNIKTDVQEVGCGGMDCLRTFDVCSENRTLSGFVSCTGHQVSYPTDHLR
jgi:hypothetical protein